jgi:hypothetical protein
MPQLDIFTYITQVYSISFFFIFFIIGFTLFWNKILFQNELLSLRLKFFQKKELFFLLQSLLIKISVKQPSFYLNIIFFNASH